MPRPYVSLKLTHKERVLRAIRRQPVDRLPTQINYTGAMGEKLAAHFSVAVEDLPERLDNHIRRVDLNWPRRTTPDGKMYFDWWGVGWSAETEGYWPLVAPLADAPDLDTFPWPDPNAPHLLDDAAAVIGQEAGEHLVAPNLGFLLFERAWSLRGFENFCLDLAADPVFAAELLDRITDIQVALARRYVALGVNAGYLGDDYGAQQGMLFSPRTWRELFKPRLARIFSVFHDAGLPVILHSDGAIGEIIPDLVEIELDLLNPVQPEVLDPAWLKRSFGDRLAFYGGVSTQTVLPFGTPEEVRAAVEKCIKELAPDGMGLVLAPSHRLTADIPMGNVEAMLECIMPNA